ncbi:MAG: DUF4340 domain-containing protein [Deltaproteobacteria bacterium]|nr:DUF4340 domain-containing protein [Deltaproteobacteria bacterium]
MNTSTIIMVVLALGSAGAAWSMRTQDLPPPKFEDTGEPLFAGFTDPTVATNLEVVAWDEEDAKVVGFKVQQTEGRWVIPSHNDYPADGTERMGKAAASFIDVEKDRYYGDNPADHAAYGVLDPDGDEGKGDEKGQRITIKDASDTVLVDIIVGKEVPEKQGFYYVREPGEAKRVYGCRLELDISTKFEDWIEKDLLGVERDDFGMMMYDPYTVDEVEGRVTGFQPVVATVTDPANRREWSADDKTEVPEGKVLDSMKVRQMLTAMASLKIVGVRPRPQARNMIEQQMLAQDMKRKGFFAVGTPDGRVQLYGNEGMLSAITDDGIVYTLLFGEVTYESGIALTAGAEEGSEPGVMEEGVEPEGEGDTNKQASRFMFVDVAYDPSQDSNLTPEPPPAEGAEGEAAASGDTDNAAKQAAGQQKAAKLRQRFDQWFYVISDSSFKQIHKERDELFKDAPEDGGAAGGGPPGGMPGGMPGFPPG